MLLQNDIKVSTKVFLFSKKVLKNIISIFFVQLLHLVLIVSLSLNQADLCFIRNRYLKTLRRL